MSNFKIKFAHLKLADQKYDDSYLDIDGKISPWSILYKDKGNKISSMNKEQAIQYVVSWLKNYQLKNNENFEFEVISNEEIESFQKTLDHNPNINNGLDVLFKIKDQIIK